MTYALITKNLALNKVAQTLAYVESELVCHQSQVRLRPPLLLPMTLADEKNATMLLCHCLQIFTQAFPLLLTFGESVASTDSFASIEMAFAAVLPQLRTAADLLQQLTLLVVNLLSQLGALCSEQTRKSTVISGAAHCDSPAPDVSVRSAACDSLPIYVFHTP